MIVTKLLGGLGNQMFQYAAGRSVSLMWKTDLKLDIFSFEHEGSIRRNYELDKFNIVASFATPGEIAKLKTNKLILRLKNTFPKLLGSCLQYKKSHIREKKFNEKFFKIPNNSYLEGQWQSEEYFKNIKSVIHREFEFKHQPDKTNLKLIHQISNEESVSIHIRKTDYLNSKNSKIFNQLGADYYISAINYLINKLKHPTFYIFTDDLNWVKNNIKLKIPLIYLTHNKGSKSHEDMRLMSYCKHNIIANSTFSWWGAWLNKNSKKIIISPAKWYVDNSLSKNVVPNSWLKI